MSVRSLEKSPVSAPPPCVPLPLLGQHRLLDPLLVLGHAGVHAGDVAPAATDAEADDAHLVPLAVLLAHQRTAPVALE